jgi:hypothetical protein
MKKEEEKPRKKQRRKSLTDLNRPKLLQEVGSNNPLESDVFELYSNHSSETESEIDMTEFTISRIDPNFGLSAITSTLVPGIYESFFSAERFND